MQIMIFYDEFEYLRREYGWKMVFMLIDTWNTFAWGHNMNEVNRLLGGNESSGGSGGSSSGRTGTKESGNGVYALNKNARKVIKSSVEDNYEKYVKFDENGKVLIDESNEKIQRILVNDPNSNFAKLFELANNSTESYFVKVIGYNDKFEICFDDWSNCINTSFSSLTQDFVNMFINSAIITGIFIAQKSSYDLIKMYNGEGNIYLGNANMIYIRSDLWGKSGENNYWGSTGAEELYYHAYNHYKSLPWWHPPGIPQNQDKLLKNIKTKAGK
jgi:hypothetical protein